MCFGGGSARRAAEQAAARAAAEQQRQADTERARLAEEARVAQEEANRRYQEERARQDAILAQQRADAEALRQQLQQQEALRLSELQRIEEARRAERENDLAAQERIRAEDLERARQQREQDLARETARREQELARQVAERTAAENAARERATQLGAYNTGRQGLIDNARKQIENAFGVYNDDYYSGVANDYLAAQKPKIDQAYDDSKRSTTFSFARRGNLKSTAAARTFGRLDQNRAEAEATAAQQAQSFANQQRGQIQSQRSNALNSIFGAVSAAPVITTDNVGDSGDAALAYLSSTLSSNPVQVGTTVQAPDLKLAFGAPVAQQPTLTGVKRANKAADGTPLVSSSGSGRLVA